MSDHQYINRSQRVGTAPRLLIFAKAPIPGQAKTRLIPALGAEGAAALAGWLLRDTVARFRAAGLTALELWCAPDQRHPVFQSIAAAGAVSVHRQQGMDLGERMQRAAADALTRGGPVVLIGCDSPALDAGYLGMALAALADHDAVLGPATDGGYVLLGLHRAEPALFAGIPWGGERVAALTRARMAVLGWRWHELPALADIDRPADLAGVGLANLAGPAGPDAG